MTAKALYFLLGMEADDEGFVDPERVVRLYGGEYGDIKNLVDTGFIIPFNSGVIVITDWHQNNYLDSKRKKPTRYIYERSQLVLTDTNRYEFNKCLTDVKPEERSIEENRIEENRITTSQSSDIDSRATYGEMGKVKLTRSEYEKLILSLGDSLTKDLITQLDLYVASKGKKYKSHYATILAWSRRKIDGVKSNSKTLYAPK